MLKAIQVMGSSSVLFSQRWKTHNSSGLSMISSCSSTFCSRTSTITSLATPTSTTRKTCSFKAFRATTTRSESNTDAPSSSSASSSSSVQSTGSAQTINFCHRCGGPTKYDIPDGEEKMRAICTLCGKITYQNPKMVVGCLIEHENKVLLCQRKIEPSYGRWTLPAGYLEVGESAAEGATRETWEEAGALVELQSPFAQLDIPLIGQTYIIFLAKLKKPHFSPGPESLDCRLFELDDIPFDSLAFSSMVVTLKLYIEDIKTGKPKFHYGTIDKRPGTSPSDIQSYTFSFHLQS